MYCHLFASLAEELKGSSDCLCGVFVYLLAEEILAPKPTVAPKTPEVDKIAEENEVMPSTDLQEREVQG